MSRRNSKDVSTKLQTSLGNRRMSMASTHGRGKAMSILTKYQILCRI